MTAPYDSSYPYPGYCCDPLKKKDIADHLIKIKKKKFQQVEYVKKVKLPKFGICKIIEFSIG